MFIHPTAVVDEGVHVGASTRIWHFCHVSSGAHVGESCVLGQNVYIANNVHIGRGVRIQNNVSVYEGVRLEDDVFVGPSCVFTNVRHPRAFLSRKSEYQPTAVGRGATLGANCTIVCGVHLGEFSFVAAGSVVTKDVVPHALVAGNPARRIGWVSRRGCRLPEGNLVRCPESDDWYATTDTACIPVPAPAMPAHRVPPAPTSIAMADLAAQNRPLLPELRDAFERILTGGHFILGREVERFEDACARHLGVAHAIGVSSGTDALMVALMALGVGPGAEVITTAYSFFATASAIARLGARPVFVDIREDTFNLDENKVEAAITSRTRALVPVHLFGQACNMPPLLALAQRHGFAVVEDGAQAFGVETPLGFVGTLGTLGTFSFFPSKNLGGFGDGGLVTCQDAALAQRVRHLRTHGASRKNVHTDLGGNFRLDALQAALLGAKLPHLSLWLARRERHARLYDALFVEAALPKCVLQGPQACGSHGWNQYVIRTPFRDHVQRTLAARGVASEVYYPTPLPYQPAFQELAYRLGQFPVAEMMSRECLALPVHAELSEQDIRRVADLVVQACNDAPNSPSGSL